MTMKIFSLFLVAYSFTLGTHTYANNIIDRNKVMDVKTQKFSRFMDTNDEYGKSCEEYSYITSLQRLKLIKENFLLGDILSDSLSISDINRDQLVVTNLGECNVHDVSVNEFTYKENISYLNENIVSIQVFQYEYGASTAHSNDHISYYMYDREYGMKLDWDTLFGQNEAFDKYVFERVLKELADEDFIRYYKASEQLFNFRNAGYFTITNKGLLIQYGKYEITPGSSGLPSIVVPRKVLKQYMTTEMYEKCFYSKNPMLAKVTSKI